MRPRLLDLFCGAGGAAMGYHRAGFEVTGVDLVRRQGYPFQMIQADALWFGSVHGSHFDAIHASPPCQAYSIATADHSKGSHPDLVADTRQMLATTGRPWIIENVPGAPLRPDFKLCGCMFGLPNLARERWFETSWQGFDLRPPCYHPEPTIAVVSGGIQTWNIRQWGRIPAGPLHELRSRAMGIGWMKRNDLALAIPPAYTEYLGRELMDQLV